MLQKKAEQKLFILNIIGFVLVGLLALGAFVLANLWATGEQTEDTYDIMYTVAIAFGFDILVIQTAFAVVQMLILRHVGAVQQEGDSRIRRFLRLLISRELAMLHTS